LGLLGFEEVFPIEQEVETTAQSPDVSFLRIVEGVGAEQIGLVEFIVLLLLEELIDKIRVLKGLRGRVVNMPT
jgi:hypothetical protein